MLFIFFNASVIRHPWLLKTVVFQHWCLIHAVPLMGRFSAAPLLIKVASFVTKVDNNFINKIS